MLGVFVFHALLGLWLMLLADKPQRPPKIGEEEKGSIGEEAKRVEVEDGWIACLLALLVTAHPAEMLTGEFASPSPHFLLLAR